MIPLPDRDDHDDVRQELAAKVRSMRLHQRRLAANPDCRDPDHPGCPRCMEDDDTPKVSEWGTAE